MYRNQTTIASLMLWFAATLASGKGFLTHLFFSTIRRILGVRPVWSLSVFIGLGFADSSVYGIEYRYVPFDVPGSTSTWLEGINNQGHIVGRYNGSTGHAAFVYDGTEFVDLPTHNDEGLIPSDINEQGQIVGTLFSDSTTPGLIVTHGFLLDAGVITVIDFPGATYSGLSGLNNLGELVGSYSIGPGLGPGRGFVYDGTDFKSIAVPDAFSTGGSSVNDSGTIAGDFAPVNLLSSYGYLLRNGQFHTLDAPFAKSMSISDINSQDAVAGTYLYSVFDGLSSGFVLDGLSVAYIRYPGSPETRVHGINDLNQVVGTYRDINGRYRGFVAHPIPEPPTPAMFVLPAAVFAAMRPMRKVDRGSYYCH